jgi:hypothetical protein
MQLEATQQTEDVPPDPGAMIESMRAFGYSLPSAIADVVDNSVSADADTISIAFHWNGEASWIRVADKGHGMDEQASRTPCGSAAVMPARSVRQVTSGGLALDSRPQRSRRGPY